jgi:hypothetical protein
MTCGWYVAPKPLARERSGSWIDGQVQPYASTNSRPSAGVSATLIPRNSISG